MLTEDGARHTHTHRRCTNMRRHTNTRKRTNTRRRTNSHIDAHTLSGRKKDSNVNISIKSTLF
jgi:hypothetical protein